MDGYMAQSQSHKFKLNKSYTKKAAKATGLHSDRSQQVVSGKSKLIMFLCSVVSFYAYIKT